MALKPKCTCTHIFQGVTYVQRCMTHTVPSVQNQGITINKDHTLKRLWLRVTRKMMNDGAKMTRKRRAEASVRGAQLMQRVCESTCRHCPGCQLQKIVPVYGDAVGNVWGGVAAEQRQNGRGVDGEGAWANASGVGIKKMKEDGGGQRAGAMGEERK
jgi:hypothetical protein